MLNLMCVKKMCVAFCRQETELVRLSVAHILQTKISMWFTPSLCDPPSGLDIM